MNVTFRQRKVSLSTIAYLPKSVECRVERFSKKAVGGCKEAVLQLKSADRRDLYDLLNWLRFRVEISSDNGDLVWWGYIGKVEIQDGPMRVTADLETMYNRIAIAYTTVAYGEDTVGERMTTDWIQDDTSVNEFGARELLDGRGGTTAILAAALQARLLAQKSYPTAFFEPSAGDNQFSATITCRGWWDTLGWKYAPVPTRLALGFETIGEVSQTLGYTDDVIAVAQVFDVSSAINLQQIGIYVGKVGTPANDLTVSIWTNPDDLTPGTQLASTTIAVASVSTTSGWLVATLSSALALAVGTYFLVVSTSGSDASNYYVLTLDGAQGYGAGAMRKEISTTWSDLPDVDLPFQLFANDLIKTTQQVKSMIANFGQFLKKVLLDIASGISTESFRFGDTDAQVEIEEMLESGTTNNRRIFASVDPERNVRLYEQPASTEFVLLDRNGIFRNLSGGELDLVTCPVGMWAMPSGIVPSNVDMTTLLGVQLFLVEESEYEVATRKLSYTPANIENPYDLGVSHG